MVRKGEWSRRGWKAEWHGKANWLTGWLKKGRKGKARVGCPAGKGWVSGRGWWVERQGWLGRGGEG